MEKLEITLESEDMVVVREVVATLAKKEGIAESEAAKILLGWGIANYRQQVEMEQRQAAREKSRQEEAELRQSGKLAETTQAWAAALKAGQNTRQEVAAYLENLSDTELNGTVAEVLTGKTARAKLKNKEMKINLIVSRVCHGDAFLQR